MSKPYKVKDPYFLKAKKEGYRARSAYKLLGIQKKFQLIHKGQTVVDLGAAPGSFLQVIAKIVGPEGKAIGVDITEMDPLDMRNVMLIQGNIFQTEPLVKFIEQKGFSPADVVTSDLAPKTSGVKDLDQGRSMELTSQAALIAMRILKPGGHFVGKVFQNEDLSAFLSLLRKKFDRVTTYKPPATRERSFETFVVAKGFRGQK